MMDLLGGRSRLLLAFAAWCWALVGVSSAQEMSWNLGAPWSADPLVVERSAAWAWQAVHVAPAPDLPSDPAIFHEPARRIVLVAYSDGTQPAQQAIGFGGDLGSALRDAVKQALLQGAGDDTRWMTVELVQHTWAMALPGSGVVPDYETGLDGLVFELDGQVLVLPPQYVVARDLIGARNRFDFDALQEALGPQDARPRRLMQLWRSGGLQATAFTVTAAFADETGVRLLYRGHRMDHDLSASALRQAAARGGQYLARSVDDQGRFVYRFKPEKTDSPKGDNAYNIVRHAGTVYAMFELHAQAPDKALLAAALRALNYLGNTIQEVEVMRTPTLCVVEDDEIKLGSNALALLAYTEHAAVTGKKDHLETMRGLAQWILATQAPNGMFLVHKQIRSTGEVPAFESSYYPGEAILALLRLYALTNDQPYLDAAERGADYLVKRDQNVPLDKMQHDHWLLYALDELSRHRSSPQRSQHAQRIVAAIIGAQHRAAVYPDWNGGFYEPPRAAPTATRAEGLAAVWRLLAREGDQSRLPAIVEAVRLATQFQLRLQVEPELAMYLPDPPRALGGLRDGFDDVEIRIDYVQHSISALLGAAAMTESTPAAKTPSTAKPGNAKTQKAKKKR